MRNQIEMLEEAENDIEVTVQQIGWLEYLQWSNHPRYLRNQENYNEDVYSIEVKPLNFLEYLKIKNS